MGLVCENGTLSLSRRDGDMVVVTMVFTMIVLLVMM